MLNKSIYNLGLALWWFVVACLLALPVGFAQEGVDSEAYLKIANESFQELVTGEVQDVAALIKKQEQLMAIGVTACRAYAKIYPEHAKFLLLVADSADEMVKMTQQEITRHWYRGEYLKGHGIDIHNKDHFHTLTNLMDLVVHPAYVIITMKMYQETPDKKLLKRAKYELGELISHAEILFEKRSAN